jgi:hypothetical protein
MEHLCGVWGAGEESGVGVQGGKQKEADPPRVDRRDGMSGENG